MSINKRILFFLLISFLVFLPIYGHIQENDFNYNKHEKIINKEFYAPFQYRYVSYFINFSLANMFLFLGKGIAITLSTFLINFILCFFSIILFDRLLNEYKTTEKNFIIMLFLLIICFMRFSPSCTLIPIDNMINLFFIIAGLIFIKKNDFKKLILTVFLGSFFREAILILVFIYFILNRNEIKKTIFLAISGIVPLLSIRLFFGKFLYRYSLIRIFYFSFDRIMTTLIYLVPFLILIYLSYLGKKVYRESFYSKIWLAIPFYLIIIILIGMPRETRLFLPLLPVMSPLIYEYIKKI